MEHTPTPWKVDGKEGSPNCYITAVESATTPVDGAVQEFDYLIAVLEPDNELEGYGTREGNAQFIVKACNNFENLIEICQTVLLHLPDKDVEGSWDYESGKLLREAITSAGVQPRY